MILWVKCCCSMRVWCMHLWLWCWYVHRPLPLEDHTIGIVSSQGCGLQAAGAGGHASRQELASRVVKLPAGARMAVHQDKAGSPTVMPDNHVHCKTAARSEQAGTGLKSAWRNSPPPGSCRALT